MSAVGPDERPPVTAFWLNVYAALAILVPYKLALVANNIFGTEGYASPGNLLGKLPLLLGEDVLGAFGIASVVWLGGRLLRGGALAVVFTLVLQGVHGWFNTVSFWVTLIVGGPLTKAVIDLATLQETTPAASGSGPALASSVARYLGPLEITAMAVSVAIPIAAILWGRRRPPLGARPRRTLRGALVAVLALGVFVLPWLVNGHLFGIRLHTYGLEKSGGVELASSYARSALDALRPASDQGGGFVLDMATGPIDGARNPLRDAAPKRTNVILVSLESVGGVYLDDPERMPFLGSIGKTPGGVALSNHYAVWPQTMKAFFSVFCGELPYPHYQTISMVNPSIPCVSVSQALSKAGYYTALVTSADLAYDRKRRFFRHRAFDHVVDMRDIPGREGAWGNSWGLDERVAVKHILDLVAEPRDQPFFAFYELYTAHHPYDGEQAHVDNPLSDERAAYLRALRYIDDRMRDLVVGLEKLGQRDNTLIVMFSDHGEGFGQHAGSRGHGAKVYQEGVYVPLAILGPQLANVSGQVTLPTSHIDIAPTLLGLVDVEVPCTMKGRDLTAASDPRLVYFGGRPPGGQLGLVDGRWKYIREDNGLELLFDLQTDPAERESLADQHPERVAAYGARIDAWSAHSTRLVERYASVLAQSECRP